MSEYLGLNAVHGEVLGIEVYRGLGRLSDIARISAPDIFDQKRNPTGTQRDLNVSHAKAAYEYVKTNVLAFWPEVVLCCRKPDVVKFRLRDRHTASGILSVDIAQITKLHKRGRVAISRLDGNHRLHFAAGSEDEMEPIDRQASFCLLMGLRKDQEIALFRDINNNQRRMSTSHLDTISTRLTAEERLMKEEPDLYVAKRLGDDLESPLHGRIWEGGRKAPEFHIPLRTLRTGIEYLRQRSTKIEQLDDVEAEYLFVRNYWLALRDWVPGAWEEPKKYLLLRGAGLWGACILGGMVIDRCLETGKYSAADMLAVLQSGPSWNWTTDGNFRGYSGRGGAVEIANKISRDFPTESGVSIRKLAQKIKGA